MSKFYFENEYGQRIDLQDNERYCMVTDSSGFGITYDASYTMVGDLFFQDTRKMKQSDLKINLNFTRPNVFEKLQAVGNFIMNASSLYFVYAPDLKEKTEYRRDVDVVGFEKADKQGGMLTYQVTMNARSLFYTTNQNRFLIEREAGEMRFGFRWPARFNDYSNRQVTFINDGHVDAPITVDFYGYVEYPKVMIYRGTELLHEQYFDLIVQENEHLLYSTMDGNLYAYHKMEDGSQKNIIHLFDLGKENFFKLPKGSITVKFTSDTGMMSKIYMNIYKFYKIV